MISLDKRRARLVAIAMALLVIASLSAVTIVVVGSRLRDGTLKFSLGRTRIVSHLELIAGPPKLFWKIYRNSGSCEVYALIDRVYFDLQIDGRVVNAIPRGNASGVKTSR